MADLSQVLKELKELRAELRLPCPRLLTVEQAAAYLGLASKTIRNALGRPVKVGGRVLFKKEALDLYIDSLGADA
jgi:excisionase family DNA binding protein